MASNLGTSDTPRRESSGKKSPRLTRAQRKAMDVDIIIQEDQNEISEEEKEEVSKSSSKKSKR